LRLYAAAGPLDFEYHSGGKSLPDAECQVYESGGSVLLGDQRGGADPVSVGDVYLEKYGAPVYLQCPGHSGVFHGRPAVPGHVRPVPPGGGAPGGPGPDHLRGRENMGIVVNLDVMMAKRKMSL